MRNIATGHIFFYPLIDTECCTSETPQTRRSMFDKTRPRLLPPPASTALRPTTFSSFPPTARAAALDAVGLIIYVTRIKLQANLEHGLGLPRPAAARPPLRQGPRRATAKTAGSASAPGRYAST
jgi:hypothetical protein